METFLEFVKNLSIKKKDIGKIRGYKVYLVDASCIRDKSQKDDEFNHIGTHLLFPKLVPDKEIWISDDLNEKERRIMIDNGINQYEGKNKSKDWYDYALKKEKAEREKIDGVKFNKKTAPPANLYYKKYCTIKANDIIVWLVDGEKVRDLYKTDFIEGGNPSVYKWIPHEEIWIEKNLKKEEIDVIILHEYVESTLMQVKKLTYDKAHDIASEVDWNHRHRWSKQDTESLTKEKALSLAKKYDNL